LTITVLCKFHNTRYKFQHFSTLSIVAYSQNKVKRIKVFCRNKQKGSETFVQYVSKKFVIFVEENFRFIKD
jgi:hypothetical protein